MMTALTILMLLCAVVPAALFIVNLKLYRKPQARDGAGARVSVLIPARNEEQNIRVCVEQVLYSQGAELEVLVLDDASTDRTAAVVQEIAAHDERVQLLSSRALPAGWNGKQHACWQLANAATSPHLLFLDADVRLHYTAIARCLAERQRTGVALLSGFPRQITVSWLEKMLIPLIHFVLLGFLPLDRMRRTTDPALAAGCGQFLLVDREAYFASGGHEAIRATMHDGLLLPRALRRAGFRTDLVDLTHLAHVRMYDTTAKVWQGLAKNATEGIAAPARIVPLTLLLLLGQVAPAIAFTGLCAMVVSIFAVVHAELDNPLRFWLFAAAVTVAATCSYVPRLLAVRRFRQPLVSALLHPLGILLLLSVQWYALTRQLLNKPVGWRQRDYSSENGTEVK